MVLWMNKLSYIFHLADRDQVVKKIFLHKSQNNQLICAQFSFKLKQSLEAVKTGANCSFYGCITSSRGLKQRPLNGRLESLT